MAKIIVSNLMTLDGYLCDSREGLDWFRVDEEWVEYSRALCASVGGFLFGRRTYEMMAAFWPLEGGKHADPFVAEHMNGLPKIVISKSLVEPIWSHSRVIRERVPESVAELKEHSSRDFALLGSGQRVSSLLPLGLIDELRIAVHPTILDGGRKEFTPGLGRVELKLLYARPFRSGMVMLSYAPKAARHG